MLRVSCIGFEWGASMVLIIHLPGYDVNPLVVVLIHWLSGLLLLNWVHKLSMSC